MPSIINATTTAGVAVTGDNSGALALQTNNGTTAVTIDTSQNVGIGETSPAGSAGYTQLVVRGSSGAELSLKGGTTQYGYVYVDNGGFRIINPQSGSSSGTLQFSTSNTERMRITNDGLLQFNSGYGSVATAYGCRAWVNFDGTTSPGTIRGSGNVSSVSRTGTGQYTVNFSNAMPDANYSLIGTTNQDTRVVSIGNLLAASAAIRTTNAAGALENQTLIAVAVFR